MSGVENISLHLLIFKKRTRAEAWKTKFRWLVKLGVMICVTGICVLLIEPTRQARFVVPVAVSVFMLSEKQMQRLDFFFLHIVVPDMVSVSV